MYCCYRHLNPKPYLRVSLLSSHLQKWAHSLDDKDRLRLMGPFDDEDLPAAIGLCLHCWWPVFAFRKITKQKAAYRALAKCSKRGLVLKRIIYGEATMTVDHTEHGHWKPMSHIPSRPNGVVTISGYLPAKGATGTQGLVQPVVLGGMEGDSESQDDTSTETSDLTGSDDDSVAGSDSSESTSHDELTTMVDSDGSKLSHVKQEADESTDRNLSTTRDAMKSVNRVQAHRGMSPNLPMQQSADPRDDRAHTEPFHIKQEPISPVLTPAAKRKASSAILGANSQLVKRAKCSVSPEHVILPPATLTCSVDVILVRYEPRFFAIDAHLQKATQLLTMLGYGTTSDFSALIEWIRADAAGALSDIEDAIKADCGGVMPIFARKTLAVLQAHARL